MYVYTHTKLHIDTHLKLSVIMCSSGYKARYCVRIYVCMYVCVYVCI